MYLNLYDICFRWLITRVRSGQSLGGSAPILRVLFSLDVSDVSRGGSEVVGEFSRCSRVSWLESHPASSGVSNIVTRYDILGDPRSALVAVSMPYVVEFLV